MSGNNPHHLSQPQNSSWNPLQIPSYIPRQPQLAHMSNERPMVRSPLAWHTPTPPESLYNFISANHKNLEQLNPMLPSFVRGPSPFDSMDLSLQSNRNSSSPLTKGLSASVPPEFGHKPPPPPPPSHSQNNFPIHNLSTNSNVHHTQSMSSAAPPPPPPPLSKYLQTNGNDVEMQQQACGLYIRDTDRINDDYAKNRTCENDIQSNLTKPVELVKECTYTNLSNKLIPNSPKKISPPPSQQQIQLQQQLQQQYSCSSNGPNSPDNSRLTHLSNFNTPLNHMLTESTTSGSCLPPKCGTDLTTASTVTENSCNSLSTNDSPANVTSNEDSVDSSGSRTRRKRKPNKTVRMSHDSETDENISLGEQAAQPEKQTPPPLLPTIAEVSNGLSQPERTSSQQQQLENTPFSDQRNSQQQQAKAAPVPKSPSPPTVATLTVAEHLQTTSDNNIIDIRSSTESDDNLNLTDPANNNQLNRSDSDDVETIDKIAEMIAQSSSSNSSSQEPTSNANNSKKTPSSPVIILNDDEEMESSFRKQGTRTPGAATEQLSGETSTKSNDCLKSILETSDPILTSGTSQKPISTVVASSSSPRPPPAEVVVEIAEDIEEKKSAPDNKTDMAKSTFEEVEYKLEEMFAGIEDEPQPETAAPADDTTISEVTTDLSLALALPTKQIKDYDDDDDDSEHKPLSVIASTSNAIQKRLHSTPKSAPGPVKKKARLTKKPMKKKQKSRVTASSASTSKSFTAQGNKSKGGGNSVSSSGAGANSSKASAAKVEDTSAAATVAESKYRGPYVLVKPDGTINVINAPIAEDDPEKVNKVKKGPNTHVDRSKIRGIHMSTLGNKYDADTADATWMCVFCKKGPHKFGLGDLFGPYIITSKCAEFEAAEKDEVDSEFVSRRKKSEMFQKTPYSMPVVPSSHSNAANLNNKKKKKLSESQTSVTNEKSPEDLFFGMSKVSDTSFEVWLHEDCTVWAPGVFLVGARIVGLESSVWSSTHHTCNLCTQKGAMVCCLQRGCGEKAHIPCARLSNWDLNERDFKTYCEKHSEAIDASSS